LKLVFDILVAIDVSLIAWTAQNYATAERAVLLPGMVAIVVLSVAVARVNHLAIRRFRTLEKL